MPGTWILPEDDSVATQIYAKSDRGIVCALGFVGEHVGSFAGCMTGNSEGCFTRTVP